MTHIGDIAQNLKRTLPTVVVSIALSIAALLAVSSGSTARREQAEQLSSHLLKAIGCELVVPITENGRDPVQVAGCWTAEGLTPPAFITP